MAKLITLFAQRQINLQTYPWFTFSIFINCINLLYIVLIEAILPYFIWKTCSILSQYVGQGITKFQLLMNIA